MANPYQKYKQTAIMSASKDQILLMLYEGAIRFTKMAITAAEQNNVPDRGKYIMRAYDIILEFQASLDHSVAGDLPQQLENLYVYMLEQYTKANLTGNVDSLKSCVQVLENLYQGWSQVINKEKKDQTGGAA
jgi:flagellar secretion chaperone FliS